MSNKPLGGRGKKAPYETTMVRCPLPIKSEVEQLIDSFKTSVLNGETVATNNQSSNDIEQCLKLVNRFIVESEQVDKLHTRNNVNLVRFRNWLESLKSSSDSDML